MKKQNGFTLIELLIVIGILASISTIIMVVLVNSLRTSAKTNILNIVKENGDFAITQMADTVRYAASVQCGSASSPSLTVNATNGSQTIYTCSGYSILSSNGSISPTPILDATSVYVSACSFTCVQPSQYAVPLVQISFILNTTSTGTLVEQTAPPEQFSTSVSLRNVTR